MNNRLHKLLEAVAETARDAADRPVRTISDTDARRVAEDNGIRLRDVYLEALQNGICPLRYLRNRETITLKEQIKLFEALQSLASATMKNPDDIAGAQKLADTGLLPKFIEALPYKSEILSLSEDSYASFTADQRATLEASLAAKLQQYRDINETVDGWIKLNPGDPDASKVYPLHLSYLP